MRKLAIWPALPYHTMSDIVERLVALANSLGGTEEDDIMAGVAEIERLREALQEARAIIDYVQHSEGNDFSKELAAIDAALKDTKP
jgi:hypothetical protein